MTLSKLQYKLNIFFKLLNVAIKSKPYFVVIILHEYFRNLYPEDIYLNFSEKNHEKRISNKLQQLINLLKILNKIKSYEIKFEKKIYKNLQEANDNIFSKIFLPHNNKFHKIKYFKSLKNLGLNKNYFRNKKILDAGTGTGRHAKLLSGLSTKKIIAIDHKISISKNLKNSKVKNIVFQEGDVLNLKFNNSVFDFINCYGVLHHTNSIEQGIKELLRVLKKGGYLYLYIYGSGGIYWNSRKKMNKLFKKIPQDYTSQILKLINVPNERFIFEDCWYAPIEIHTSQKKLEQILNNEKIEFFKRETNNIMQKNKLMWGEGELKYLIKK